MTEVEWATAETPGDMLEWVGPHASERKLRLFAVSCLRHGWELLPESWHHGAIEVAEKYVEGEVDEPTRAIEHDQFAGRLMIESGDDVDAYWDHTSLPLLTLSPQFYFENAIQCSEGMAFAAGWFGREQFDGIEQEILAEHAALVRDIFGNPFRPTHIDPRWRTSTVVAVATAIYAERDFAAMPVLADALEEAGCDAWDVLAHCRGGGTHVRGCWLLDKLLGKG